MARQRRRWFLKEWRKHRQLSQEALAHRAGLTQGMISQLEHGTSDYTGRQLENLSKALNCTVYELLFRDPAWPESPASAFAELAEEDQGFAIEMLRTIKRRRGG